MATLSRERKRLAEYRRQLKQAEKKLAELQEIERRAEGLRQIVAGFERIPGILEEDASQETAPETSHIQPETPPMRAPRGLPSAIRNLMADGKERDVGEVLTEVSALPQFQERPPKRMSISNRLNELFKAGYLQRLDRGVYVVSANPSANGSQEQPREGLIFPPSIGAEP